MIEQDFSKKGHDNARESFKNRPTKVLGKTHVGGGLNNGEKAHALGHGKGRKGDVAGGKARQKEKKKTQGGTPQNNPPARAP